MFPRRERPQGVAGRQAQARRRIQVRMTRHAACSSLTLLDTCHVSFIIFQSLTYARTPVVRPATDVINSYDRNTYMTIPLTRERNLRATDDLRRGVVVMILFDCNLTI